MKNKLDIITVKRSLLTSEQYILLIPDINAYNKGDIPRPGRCLRLMTSLWGSHRIRVQTQIAQSRRLFESGKSGHRVWKVCTWVAPSVAPHPKSDPSCIVAPRVWVWKVWTRVLESLDLSRAKGRTAFGFRPKLHSRAESLSLESLDIKSRKSRATMKFNLNTDGCGATFGATNVQTFQTLCPDFPDSNFRRDYAIWV